MIVQLLSGIVTYDLKKVKLYIITHHQWDDGVTVGFDFSDASGH